MNNNEELILFCAFRYALGRQTTVVSCIVEEIISKWNDISDGNKTLYQSEIFTAIQKGQAGSKSIDVPQWNRILELPSPLPKNSTPFRSK